MKSIALLLLYLTCGQAYAQCTAADPLSAQWVQTAKAAVDDARETTGTILDQVRPHLLASQQRLADPSKFLVGAFHEFNGKFDPVRKEVHLPLGLWLETWLIGETYADVYEQPELAPKVGGYIRFLTSCSKKIRATSLAQPLLTFRQWGQIAPRNPGTPVFESTRRKIRVDMLTEAMAFVTLHELAHLLMDHKASGDLGRTESFDQEFAADIRARRLMEKSGFELMPAITILGRMGMLQISDDNQLIQSSTHPHPLCRMYKSFTVEAYKERNNPTSRASVQRFGLTFDQLMQNLLIAKEAC